MGVFVRLYAFLSQIFDYGNTGIEKRFLFCKRLIPLLDFGRERDRRAARFASALALMGTRRSR